MKIGIVTNYEWLKQWSNYGTLLQNVALQKALEKLGHQPYWILTNGSGGRSLSERLRNICYQIRFQPKKLLTSCLLRKSRHKQIGEKKRTHREFNSSHPRYFEEFLRNSVATSDGEYNVKRLRESPPKADAYIVGSDNVWADVSPAVFLDFGPAETLRISYAVSAPWSKLGGYWYARASREIGKFDAISVRESEGLEVCRKLFRGDAVHVLDPTLLLTADDYQEMIERAQSDFSFKKLTMLGYLMNVETLEELPWEVLKSYAVQSSIDFKVVPLQGSELIIPEEHVFCPSPIDWLSAYANAQCIVTNSFHGTIFSIIFNKPFLVVTNGMEGSGGGSVRFESLLKIFGLEERIFSGSGTEVFKKMMEAPVDWQQVNARLVSKREESLKFLVEALNGKE